MDYFPRQNSEQERWARRQKEQRPTYATQLGLTTDDVNALDQEDDEFIAAHQKADKAQAASKSATEELETLKKTYIPKRRGHIAHNKTHPKYTPAMGKDNEWVGPEGEEKDDLKPTLKPTRTALGWSFAWPKMGQAYMRIYRRQAGTTDWGKYLAIDSRSPYVDTEEGLTGDYEYYGQLYDADDQPVGQPSDIVVAKH